MQISLSISRQHSDFHRWVNIEPYDGLIMPHFREIVNDLEGCQSILAKIIKAKEGTPTYARSDVMMVSMDEKKVVLEPIMDGIWKVMPKIIMSIDEYEKLLHLWKNFLETGEEVHATLGVSDESILEMTRPVSFGPKAFFERFLYFSFQQDESEGKTDEEKFLYYLSIRYNYGDLLRILIQATDFLQGKIDRERFIELTGKSFETEEAVRMWLQETIAVLKKKAAQERVRVYGLSAAKDPSEKYPFLHNVLIEHFRNAYGKDDVDIALKIARDDSTPHEELLDFLLDSADFLKEESFDIRMLSSAANRHFSYSEEEARAWLEKMLSIIRTELEKEGVL